MKVIKTFSICAAIGSAFLISNVNALDLGDLTAAAGALQKGNQAVQTLQGGQTAGAAIPGAATTGGGLTGVLMQQLGVSQAQATGGAGAIFQLAKSKMQADAFTKLSSSVPGMSGLLSAAPVANPTGGTGLGALASAASGLTGGASGSAGNLLGLAGSFQQLGLSPDMVQKFVPVVMQYVQGSGGGAVSSMLQSALMGGM